MFAGLTRGGESLRHGSFRRINTRAVLGAPERTVDVSPAPVEERRASPAASAVLDERQDSAVRDTSGCRATC